VCALPPFGLLMMPTLPAVMATTFGALLLLRRQQQEQHCPQQGWRAMQRAMLLLLQLSRASLCLLCGSR
jgi:hypothetical protein